MYATDLIGKTCIREKPVAIKRYVSTGYGLLYGSSEKEVEDQDYTYCNEPVRIVAATEHNIICERKGFNGTPYVANLDERYCDCHWVDYDALIKSGAGFINVEPETSGGDEQGA